MMIRMKLIVVLLGVVCVLGTSACGSDDKTAEDMTIQDDELTLQNNEVDGNDSDKAETDEQKTEDQRVVVMNDTTMIESEITEEDAFKLLEDTIGIENPDNGNLYSYGFLCECIIDDEGYYAYQWKWMVNNSHLSSLGDLFVKADGKAIYVGTYDATLGSTLDTSQNLLENPDVGLTTTITENEAEVLLLTNIGDQDEDTGNIYSYGFIEKCSVAGESYYAYQWNWIVDKSTLSSLGYLFVNTDGMSIYAGTYVSDGTSELDTSHNYVKRK